MLNFTAIRFVIL